MTKRMSAHGNWTRIGVGTDWTMGIVALGLSLFIGFGIPREKWVIALQGFGANVDNSNVNVWVTAVTFVIVSPVLLFLTTRRARIDTNRRLLRVGWRTIPFDQLKYVYRTPGGQRGDQFMIRLDVALGLDARLPIHTASQPDLNAAELEALLALLHDAPIVPKPGVILRAPLGNELGSRNESEQISDAVSEISMAHRREAYAKATVILEVQQALDAARADDRAFGDVVGGGSPGGRAASAFGRALQQTSPYSSRDGVPLPKETGRRLHSRFSRGLVGTLGPAFRRQRASVALWLASHNMTQGATWSRLKIRAWMLFALCLLLSITLFGSILGFLAPLGVWAAILMLYRDRVRHYCQLRNAVVKLRLSGTSVPKKVWGFFGERFPERAMVRHLFYSRAIVGTLFFFLALLLATGNFPITSDWYHWRAWQRPLALVIAILTIWNFVDAVREVNTADGEIVRASRELALLSTAPAAPKHDGSP